MKLEEVMHQLEECGTEQNRKIYINHDDTSCKTPEAEAYIKKLEIEKEIKKENERRRTA